MKQSTHFPSVRLAAAGYGSVLLLAWITFVPGSFPPLMARHLPVYPPAFLVTAAISLLILVVLAPVVWHGPGRDRALALLAGLFPLLVFAVVALLGIGAWIVGT
jgi:hypothetical protein